MTLCKQSRICRRVVYQASQSEGAPCLGRGRELLQVSFASAPDTRCCAFMSQTQRPPFPGRTSPKLAELLYSVYSCFGGRALCSCSCKQPRFILEECKCSDTSVAKLSTSPLGPWCEGPQLFDQMLPINSCACVSVRFWRRRRADQALSSSSVDTLDISAQRKPPVYISSGAGIPCASCHCQDCSCVGVCATAPSDVPVRLEHGDPCSLQPGLQVRCRP